MGKGLNLFFVGLGYMIGGFVSSASSFWTITSAIFIIAGAIIMFVSYKNGQREKLEIIKRLCPNCHINIAADCKQCPRCGTIL